MISPGELQRIYQDEHPLRIFGRWPEKWIPVIELLFLLSSTA